MIYSGKSLAPVQAVGSTVCPVYKGVVTDVCSLFLGQLVAPAALPPGNSSLYPLNKRLGRPQSRCGTFRKDKCLPAAGIETQCLGIALSVAKFMRILSTVHEFLHVTDGQTEMGHVRNILLQTHRTLHLILILTFMLYRLPVITQGN